MSCVCARALVHLFALIHVVLVSLFIQLSGQVNSMHEHFVVVAIFCCLSFPICSFFLFKRKLNCSTHSLQQIIRILVLQCHVATTKLINLCISIIFQFNAEKRHTVFVCARESVSKPFLQSVLGQF